MNESCDAIPLSLFDADKYDARFAPDNGDHETMLERCRDADFILVMLSGGKDSTASLLHLLEQGISMSKIEAWHQCVDGMTVEGVSEARPLMDYACTPSYVKKLARELGVSHYFQWRNGGFEGEMLRRNAPTAKTFFETPCGLKASGGESGKVGTRLRFPMRTNDLSRRWCSASLKIDVASIAIRNQERFSGANIVYISGERAEESRRRATYQDVEAHRTNTKARTVIHWRPVLRWREERVWDMLRRHSIRPHPCYFLHEAIGRCSCQSCIFGSAMQWRIVKEIDPVRFERLADYEKRFCCTIVEGASLPDLVHDVPCPPLDPDAVALVCGREYHGKLRDAAWELPPGAFGNAECGPG